MSDGICKYVKLIPLPSGDSLMRDSNGKWVKVHKAGKPTHTDVSATQAEIIDAAILAGIQYGRAS